MWSHTVAEWMTTPALVIAPTTPLAEAQRLMEQHHVRRLPVVQDGRLVGIITWGDVRAAQPSSATTLSIYEWRSLLDKATVAECMTRDPVSVAPHTPLLEAARQMLEHKIGGLPVVADGHVVGMITESDLFRLLLAETIGVERVDTGRTALVCHHCGMVLRGRSPETIGPDDQCWRCHRHLHRCENCRYFDRIGCLLDRSERHTPIPGQHCPAFAYQPLSMLHVEERG